MAPLTPDRARHNRHAAQLHDRPAPSGSTRFTPRASDAVSAVPLSQSPFATSGRLKIAAAGNAPRPDGYIAMTGEAQTLATVDAHPAVLLGPHGSSAASATSSPQPEVDQEESGGEWFVPSEDAEGDTRRPVASWGWRGALNTLPGVSLRAGRREAAYVGDAAAVRRASQPETTQIAIVGDEGGCGRTWLTFALAQALAYACRGGVIAWDGTRRGGPLTHLGDPGGAGLEALISGHASPSSVAAMSALTARQDSAAEVLGWRKPAHSPLTPEGADIARRAVARWYGYAVVDTDADPWGGVWEAVVATSAAVVVIHSGSAWAGSSVTRTVRRVRDVAPSAHLVGATFAPQLPPDAAGIPWTKVSRQFSPAWGLTPRRHQAELMRLARSVVSHNSREDF